MAGERVIVVGGGHNGLCAAALLAKRGRDVLLLERRDVLGGFAAGEEFVSGYRHAGLLHDTTRLSPQVEDVLELHKHGLDREAQRPNVLFVAADGSQGLLAPAEIARHSPRDAERYDEYRAFLGRVEKVLVSLFCETPPDALDPTFRTLMELAGKGLRLRLLGKRDMLELLRAAPMCVADWLDEWFETDLLKAGLAGPAVCGTWLGPWSAGSVMNLLMWECTARGAVRGGGAAVARALERAAIAQGVEIRTGANVENLLVTTGGGVAGVVLGTGEELAADRVLATCDPKQTLLQLVPSQCLSTKLAHRIENFRTRGSTAAVHLALRTPLEFASRPGEAIEYARTGSCLDDLERAFDVLKYGSFPQSPVLEVFVPSFADPSLAPDGHAVVSLLVHFVPHELADDLQGGWTDARREELGDLAVATLQRCAPGVADSIVGRDVLSPADIAERYGVTGGHIHHGEHALDQLFLRPTPETSRFSTPIRGLFLGGSGSHPGGGITGMPGLLAADAMRRR